MRNASKACKYDDNVCRFPGLKGKNPVECAEQQDASSNLFPLVFDGNTISSAAVDGIDDGTELPAPATVVSSETTSERFNCPSALLLALEAPP